MTMKNFHYEGLRFTNGNLNIRFSPEEIEDIRAGRYSDIEVLSWKLERFDTYFIGEQYCLSNYDMGTTAHSAYSDHVFTISFAAIENVLMQGKTLKLYAREPDEYDRETLALEKGDPA